MTVALMGLKVKARVQSLGVGCQFETRSVGLQSSIEDSLVNKKHLKNVGPIRHCERPHADVHNNNDDDNDNA